MEAFPFYDPRRSGVAANAKAHRGRRSDNVGICRVCAHLMNIAIYIYGGVPLFSPIGGTRNAPHMNISEQYAPVRVGRDRANT